MSNIYVPGAGTEPREFVGEEPPADRPPGRVRRRGRRILLISAASLVAVIVAVAVAGFVTVNHLASNVQRIPNVFARLDAADRPVMPAATAKSMTILLTGSNVLPAKRGGTAVADASTASEYPSGLYELVHFDADLKAASVVSIPANAEVAIPGHGRAELSDALKFGGPALLIETVEKLTGVRTDHYCVVDFAGLVSALKPLGGVNVRVPAMFTSDGVVFHAGVDYLTYKTALDYVRQTSITQEGRAERQQALLRAIVEKFVTLDLISNPLRDLSLLDAFTTSLSVDGDFTNYGLEKLASELHLLRAGSSSYVTAPTLAAAAWNKPVQLNTAISGKLWQAIRHDAVAAFAKQYPATLTPESPK